MRDSNYLFARFEMIDGLSHFVGSHTNSRSQPIFGYTLIFKFCLVVGEPARNTFCVGIESAFAFIGHFETPVVKG